MDDSLGKSLLLSGVSFLAGYFYSKWEEIQVNNQNGQSNFESINQMQASSSSEENVNVNSNNSKERAGANNSNFELRNRLNRIDDSSKKESTNIHRNIVAINKQRDAGYYEDNSEQLFHQVDTNRMMHSLGKCPYCKEHVTNHDRKRKHFPNCSCAYHLICFDKLREQSSTNKLPCPLCSKIIDFNEYPTYISRFINGR